MTIYIFRVLYNALGEILPVLVLVFGLVVSEVILYLSKERILLHAVGGVRLKQIQNRSGRGLPYIEPENLERYQLLERLIWVVAVLFCVAISVYLFARMGTGLDGSFGIVFVVTLTCTGMIYIVSRLLTLDLKGCEQAWKNGKIPEETVQRNCLAATQWYWNSLEYWYAEFQSAENEKQRRDCLLQMQEEASLIQSQIYHSIQTYQRRYPGVSWELWGGRTEVEHRIAEIYQSMERCNAKLEQPIPNLTKDNLFSKAAMKKNRACRRKKH